APKTVRLYGEAPQRGHATGRAVTGGFAAGCGTRRGAEDSTVVRRGAPTQLRDRLRSRQAELRHGLGKHPSLLAQAFGRGGRLLDQRRVLLRCGLQVRYRVVDLRDALALLARGRGDLAEHRAHPLHAVEDLGHRRPGLADGLRAAIDFLARTDD